MTEKQIIFEVIQTIKIELAWAFLLAVISTGILLYIKGKVQAFVALINFKLNGEMTKHTRVNVNGKDGEIIDSNRKFIRIRLVDQGIMLINTTKWKDKTWIIRHDGEKERSTDG